MQGKYLAKLDQVFAQERFSAAYGKLPGVKCLEIEAETTFQTYAAYRNDVALSVYAEAFIELLREEMVAASQHGATGSMPSKR